MSKKQSSKEVAPTPQILVSTTSGIPGYQIVQYRGLAYGATVRSRGVAGEYCARWQTTCGGEVTAYTQTTLEARSEAINRMIQHARQLGANAIIGVKIDTDQIGQGANNVTVAYGTAVVIR